MSFTVSFSHARGRRREIVRRRRDASVFDLETAAGRERLAHPELTLAPLRGLVVIDEIQREPKLLTFSRDDALVW